ncbi:MAG TPA: PA0069 family radical SAM protein [Phnomibacter sp.]|nr:PA0069 family radical SAM protein [Phnomibacter sp.]
MSSSAAGRPSRGAGINTPNRFLRQQRSKSIIEGIDDWEEPSPGTIFLQEHAKTLVNKVTSPDVGMYYSMNPYQGCEHGCAYCYARNAHEYWGLSAGIDFEQKIIVKENAPQLLRQFLMHPSWQSVPLSLSGNTDCYQPAEQKFRITRQLLEVCWSFRQPVSIITKNAFVIKDADILQTMAAHHLTAVLVTITTQQEDLRRAMEPRTTTISQRLRVIEVLSKLGVPCGVMMGPVIPGLNDHEMAGILQSAADAGARFAAYTFVRLNGSVQLIFHEWLHKHFPDRAEKVWHMIEQGHGGKVNDSRFGTRMRGEGPMAQLIHQQFKKYCRRFGLNKEPVQLDCSQFTRPGQQLALFK